EMTRNGLVERAFGFGGPSQAEIRSRKEAVRLGISRTESERLGSILNRFLAHALPVESRGEIPVRPSISRVSPLPELVNVGIAVRIWSDDAMAAIDVKPLALTHAVATCVCFLNVMPHFGDLTQVPVNARQARVRRRKIW